ncbi:MAG: hypothetical protein AB7O73_05110, partial [Bacteroidia bacterium]
MNSDSHETVLNLVNTTINISQAVYKEIAKIESQKIEVDKQVSAAKLGIWKQNINVGLLSHLFDTYSLGDGETESTAICIENSFSLCCDDKKARSAAQKEITDARLMGSLRLLKHAVIENIIKCTDAQISYIEMKVKGGFLPKNVENNYFCSAS